MDKKTAFISLSALILAGLSITQAVAYTNRVEELKLVIKHQNRSIQNYKRAVVRVGQYLSMDQLMDVAEAELNDIVFQDIVDHQ